MDFSSHPFHHKWKKFYVLTAPRSSCVLNCSTKLASSSPDSTPLNCCLWCWFNALIRPVRIWRLEKWRKNYGSWTVTFRRQSRITTSAVWRWLLLTTYDCWWMSMICCSLKLIAYHCCHLSKRNSENYYSFGIQKVKSLSCTIWEYIVHKNKAKKFFIFPD